MMIDETDRMREMMCAVGGRRGYLHCCASVDRNYIMRHDISYFNYIMPHDIISNIGRSHAGIGLRKAGVG